MIFQIAEYGPWWCPSLGGRLGTREGRYGKRIYEVDVRLVVPWGWQKCRIFHLRRWGPEMKHGIGMWVDYV